jgi:hypothetical protein
MALSRPFLKTLAAVAMLALVAVACGGGGGKKTAAKGTTTSIEDTSTTVADTSTTAAGGATATTKAAGKAQPSTGNKVNGQSSSNYQPPPGAKAATPVAPGTYTEDNSGTSTFGAPPPKSPLVIDPPAGTRQHSTSDMRSAGKGSVSETTLDYQPDGVHLIEVKVTTFNQTLDFVGNPPPLAAPTGVKPGQSVDFDLSSNPPGTNIHVHIDFVRNETITIGGQPVNTMFIHQVGTLSGNINGTQTMDAWVSTQYDLFVKTHSTSDATASGVHFTSDVTSTLEKLTPG